MNRRFVVRFAVALRVVLLLVLLLVPASARAVEQAEQFIAGLHERGLSDLVGDYLDHIAESRLIDAEFKEKIPYLRGISQIEAARSTADPDARRRLIDQAQQAIEAYAQAHPDDDEAVEARGRLGGVLVDEARRTIARSEQRPAGSGDQQRLLEEAREQIDGGRTQFEAAETFYSTQLQKIPKTLDPRTESELIEKRQLYRGRLAQARLLVAQSDYEKAQAFPPGSSQFRELNTAAAKALGELFEQYSRWLVGFYANLYEGRCYQALGDYQKALGCYDNIVAQPDADPAFRKLITAAYRHQAECQIAQQQFDAAISSCAERLKEARGAEQAEAEWLALRYRLADAYRAKAEALGEKTTAYRNLIGNARDAYQEVAKHPGEFQQQARLAAAELRSDRAIERDPETFVAAYDAGRAAIDQLNQANVDLELARKNDQPELVSELSSQAESAQQEALRLFSLALSLADSSVETDKLNEVRYFACWLHYQAEDYYRAAILGQFLAQRYPNHAAAGAAAKLAMAAYERLYNEAIAAGAGQEETEFEASQLVGIAEFITRRWPDSDDAEAAMAVLLNFSLRHDRLDEARRMLEEVSADRRPQMEMKLGGALWAKYVQLSQQPSQEQVGADPVAVREQAIALLQQGLAPVRESGKVTPVAAAAALYLAQALISDEEYQRAVEVLEEPRIGPLTLLEKNDPAVSAPEFAAGTYRAALRAYVSATPPEVEKGVEMMDRLEKSVGSDTAAAERLTRTYISLGLELQQQIEELKTAGRESQAQRLGEAFAQFLDRVSARGEAAGWAGRSWIAQTYYNMAEGLGGNTVLGKDYFSRAAEMYRQIVAAAEQDASFAPDPLAVLAAKKQMGLALREAGEYAQALDTFSEILGEKVTRLDVQKAAAYTCQAWGEQGDPKWLERAITGGLRQRSDGKNRIWGWAYIAQVVSRYKDSNPQHRDTFFEAWLNTARCRYLIAVKNQGTKREQNLERAKTTVRTMARQYPDLGGEPWRSQFDQLARQIQEAQGTSPRGLEEFAPAALQPQVHGTIR